MRAALRLSLASVGGLLLLVGAAGCSPTPASSEPPDQQPEEPSPPGQIYGFWGLNGHVSPQGFADLRERFGITGFQVANEDPVWTVGSLLPMVRQAGLRVTLRLTGDHHAYTRDGDFDLELWKVQLDRWRDAGAQPFIDDGTLAGHMLLDDVVNFEGRDPDAADFEEMARFSKELMPGLMTFVRQKATHMPPPEGGRYVWVDAAVNQYEALEGPVEAYASVQEERAIALGLGVINGLNIADGGDGSAGRPGWRATHYPMTADEIRSYGQVLATVPSCGMFLNWEYDGREEWSDGNIGADYFDQPELQAALAELAALFAEHPPIQLLKDTGQP
jgi:hypothetical protein